MTDQQGAADAAAEEKKGPRGMKTMPNRFRGTMVRCKVVGLKRRKGDKQPDGFRMYGEWVALGKEVDLPLPVAASLAAGPRPRVRILKADE